MNLSLHFRLAVSVCLLSIALSACAAPAPASTLGPRPTAANLVSTPQPASDEEAIRQLIAAEGRGVISQDIAGLMNLWATDAVITDAKHTPTNSGDDANWRGRDAIRSRYVVLVFPGNPLAAGARDVEVTIAGDKATATSTTVIGGEVSPGGDRWSFVRRDGRWWISGLTYNLEPK
jgi:ketosteroid isomerase-like protein